MNLLLQGLHPGLQVFSRPESNAQVTRLYRKLFLLILHPVKLLLKKLNSVIVLNDLQGHAFLEDLRHMVTLIEDNAKCIVSNEQKTDGMKINPPPLTKQLCSKL